MYGCINDKIWGAQGLGCLSVAELYKGHGGILTVHNLPLHFPIIFELLDPTPLPLSHSDLPHQMNKEPES